MKKILITATLQSHIAQFHKPLMRLMKENGYEVHVATKTTRKNTAKVFYTAHDE